MKHPIPDEALAHHTILLGKTRAGKSSTMRGLVERLLDQSKPVCIIDPKGDWWGLKSSADGKRAGYKVIIFGGEHADVPLNAHSGAHVAELVATGNRPCIIDLGGWMVGERTRFFIDFASTLFRHTRGPRWLAIDEAHNFAPQGKVHDPDAGKMLHWANRLASEGAGKGITLISASQRPQKVHKDYLTSHETLIAMRVIHKLDREAIADWIRGCPDQGLGAEVLATLATMERGEGWAWSPEAKFGPVRIKFPMFSTYDSFAAPTSETVEKLKGWASVDLDDVRSKFSAIVEDAKANDPKALKAEIAQLQRELKKAERSIAAPPKPEIVHANADEIEEARRQGEITGIAIGIARAQQALKALRVDDAPATAAKAPRKAAPAPQAPNVAPLSAVPAAGLTGPQQRILNALAWWQVFGFDAPTNEQVAFIAGYSPTSTGYTNPRGALKSIGLLAYPSPGAVSLTEAGAEKAEAPEAPPTGNELRRRVLAKMSGPQQRILSVAIEAHPEALSNEDAATRAGYSHTSTGYTNPRGSLKTLSAIEYPQPGCIRASDWLFP